MDSRSVITDNTLGAAFIGMVVATNLHGVACVQAFYYFAHQNDMWPIKLLVCVVILLDTTHQILIVHSVYTHAVLDWGQLDKIHVIVWSQRVHVLFNGIITLLVQSFLTVRVWRLSHGKIALTSVLVLFVIAGFASVLVYTIKSIHFRSISQLVGLTGPSIVVSVIAAVGDVLIAAILCVILHRSRTGFHRSDTMINKLIIFAVNTGFLTSISALACLISILVGDSTYIFIGFLFCTGRLYTNSLLATLNVRYMMKMMPGIIASESQSVSLRELPRSTSTVRPPAGIAIRIDTTQEFDTDADRKLDVEKS